MLVASVLLWAIMTTGLFFFGFGIMKKDEAALVFGSAVLGVSGTLMMLLTLGPGA
jgi:hypothetical protein